MANMLSRLPEGIDRPAVVQSVQSKAVPIESAGKLSVNAGA